MAVEIDRFFALGFLEAKDDSPKPRIFRLRVRDDLVVSLACGVIEHKGRECLEDVSVAVVLTKGSTLELGEVLEPTDAQRSDRLIAGIHDHVRGLIIVAIEFVLRWNAMLLHEADCSDG